MDMSAQHPEGMGNAGHEDQLGGGVSGEGQEVEGGAKINMESAKEKLEDFDWEGLEERFWVKMEECRRVEEGIRGEFEELIQVCGDLLARVLLWEAFFSVMVLLSLCVGGLGDGWFLVGFGGCADENRYSMRGRLLALLVKKRGLGSGIYLSSSFFPHGLALGRPI